MENEVLFCAEPVVAAYEGKAGETEGFFDRYHDLALHAAPGYRLLLETEKHVISLGASGVTLSEKTGTVEDHAEPGELVESFVHSLREMGDALWEDYEATLFKGERLRSVEERDGSWLLRFDDFQLKLIPHPADGDGVPTLKSKYYMAYNHVYGCERLLERKCECGGTGELLLDPVFDYVVRCGGCGRSTLAALKPNVAIRSWNEGAAHARLPGIWIE